MNASMTSCSLSIRTKGSLALMNSCIMSSPTAPTPQITKWSFIFDIFCCMPCLLNISPNVPSIIDEKIKLAPVAMSKMPLIMSTAVNARPPPLRGLTSPYPTVDMVMMVIYSASLNDHPSMIMYPTVPPKKTATMAITIIATRL